MSLARCGRFCCITMCIKSRYIKISVFVVFCFGLVLIVNGIVADGILTKLGQNSANKNCWGGYCHRNVPTDDRNVPMYDRNIDVDHLPVPTDDRKVLTDHRNFPTDHRNVPTVAHTKLKDVFISVKTGARNHKYRITALVETWFQMAKNEVCFLIVDRCIYQWPPLRCV
jgi:hypothetical protein